jgi:hypothetical protein
VKEREASSLSPMLQTTGTTDLGDSEMTSSFCPPYQIGGACVHVTETTTNRDSQYAPHVSPEEVSWISNMEFFNIVPCLDELTEWLEALVCLGSSLAQ